MRTLLKLYFTFTNHLNNQLKSTTHTRTVKPIKKSVLYPHIAKQANQNRHHIYILFKWTNQNLRHIYWCLPLSIYYLYLLYVQGRGITLRHLGNSYTRRRVLGGAQFWNIRTSQVTTTLLTRPPTTVNSMTSYYRPYC